MKYQLVLTVLETFYSLEFDSSDMSIASLKRSLEMDPEWRSLVAEELKVGLADADFSWKKALWSKDCHVEDLETEDLARSFVIENVQSVVEEVAQGER